MNSCCKDWIIRVIREETEYLNADNVSRTMAYQRFFQKYPEIRWAFLASMVSRNAGYHMTDLESKWFQFLLNPLIRKQLFLTYERANWAIFRDAYPQLMIYEWSKRWGQPFFHWLKEFQVSPFMMKEWRHFWRQGNMDRLCAALIINEQNVIQKPVIEEPSLKKAVFRRLPFYLQELGHFGHVLLPTKDGSLFGLYTRQFQKVDARIWLGKKLAGLLFHPEVYSGVAAFAFSTEHTGSRGDYLRYGSWNSGNTSPLLRLTHPIISHQSATSSRWNATVKDLNKWMAPIGVTKPIDHMPWVKKKQTELFLLYSVKKKLRHVIPYETSPH
ncbi:DUF2515 domain-containing protein [Halalkalibacterium halodurans]|uniref:DUF2515 domain-containing protein n=1 Tax=Halalkalibacterium halodurans TaxID=86665 RepID=UPI0010FEFF54|nr:DUF2515 domain-containing protein [Halalkalibacterium halodurans]